MVQVHTTHPHILVLAALALTLVLTPALALVSALVTPPLLVLMTPTLPTRLTLVSILTVMDPAMLVPQPMAQERTTRVPTPEPVLASTLVTPTPPPQARMTATY